MKKRGLLYIIFGLIFYLLFLVIQLPASWFAWGLNNFTHGTVRVDPIAGSMWHGTGRLVIYYPQGVPHDLGSAEWRINLLWLFTGRIQMYWHAESADGRTSTVLRFGKNQAQLLETEASFPAQAVGSFYPPASLISPKGQVIVRTEKLTISNNGVEGVAEISWQNAGSSLTNVQPLGDYRLEINSAGTTADLKLTTLHGSLELTGQGQWQLQNGQFHLTGAATPRERANELEPMLNLLGPAQDGGHRPLSLNGRLSL